jgi:hypothetical protein
MASFMPRGANNRTLGVNCRAKWLLAAFTGQEDALKVEMNTKLKHKLSSLQPPRVLARMPGLGDCLLHTFAHAVQQLSKDDIATLDQANPVVQAALLPLGDLGKKDDGGDDTFKKHREQMRACLVELFQAKDETWFHECLGIDDKVEAIQSIQVLGQWNSRIYDSAWELLLHACQLRSLVITSSYEYEVPLLSADDPLTNAPQIIGVKSRDHWDSTRKEGGSRASETEQKSDSGASGSGGGAGSGNTYVFMHNRMRQHAQIHTHASSLFWGDRRAAPNRSRRAKQRRKNSAPNQSVQSNQML